MGGDIQGWYLVSRREGRGQGESSRGVYLLGIYSVRGVWGNYQRLQVSFFGDAGLWCS